jgi:hypothetical protein
MPPKIHEKNCQTCTLDTTGCCPADTLHAGLPSKTLGAYRGQRRRLTRVIGCGSFSGGKPDDA